MKRLHLPTNFRRWLIVPPVVLGVGVMALLVINKEQLKRKPERELSRVLRVIQVPQVDVVPRVLGYGTAQPGRVWRAVAEVKGRVVTVDPQLKAGAIMRAGEGILRIDPMEYELAIAQLQADIEQVQANLSELDAREANHRASLKIEEASLVLAQQSLERTRKAAMTNAVAATQVDEEQRNVLAQQQKTQSYKNSLNLLPAERKSMQASLAVKKARLAQAELDLKKTSITVPFDCRLGEVMIEKGQFLSAGEALFEAHSTDVTEVDAQVPIDKLRTLINVEDRGKILSAMSAMDRSTVRKLFDVDVKVTMITGDFRAQWEGRFSRIRELIDPQTRTIGIVVAVDKPYEKIIPGQRPPLIKGMFCEVELIGRLHKRFIVIPRVAIHQGYVYLVNQENRLERRKIEIAIEQSNFAALESGLQEGETLVISDATPAIEGMLVQAIVDEKVLKDLVAEAKGERALK